MSLTKNLSQKYFDDDKIIRTRNYSKYDPINIDYLNKIEVSTVTTVVTVPGAYTITVASAVGITAGKYLYLYNATQGFLYQGFVRIVAGNVLTMDTPINEAFAIGSNVDSAEINMAVDGSVTPQSFRLRGAGSDNLFFSFIVNRVIFYMETASSVSLNAFGDLPVLTRGLVLREINGVTTIITNIKSNGDLYSIAYDTTFLAATNPALDQDGLVARLTFGGDSKIGAAIALQRTDDLEAIVQDNLTGLEKFYIRTEGYLIREIS